MLYVVEKPSTLFNRERERLIAEWSRADLNAKRLTRELKKLDPHLELGFCDPEAAKNRPEDLAPGVVPGRWHVIRKNPKGLDSYFPIMGPNKEYVEPTDKIIEDMKAADLWRRGALQELNDRLRRNAEKQKRQEQTENEQRRDEIAEIYRAVRRMPGDGGMERNHAKKRKAA